MDMVYGTVQQAKRRRYMKNYRNDILCKGILKNKDDIPYGIKDRE